MRVEKSLLKVLKGLAEYRDISLGDLLEASCDTLSMGKPLFQRVRLRSINKLKNVYNYSLTAADSHKMREANG